MKGNKIILGIALACALTASSHGQIFDHGRIGPMGSDFQLESVTSINEVNGDSNSRLSETAKMKWWPSYAKSVVAPFVYAGVSYTDDGLQNPRTRGYGPLQVGAGPTFRFDKMPFLPQHRLDLITWGGASLPVGDSEITKGRTDYCGGGSLSFGPKNGEWQVNGFGQRNDNGLDEKGVAKPNSTVWGIFGGPRLDFVPGERKPRLGIGFNQEIRDNGKGESEYLRVGVKFPFFASAALTGEIYLDQRLNQHGANFPERTLGFIVKANIGARK